MVSLWKPTCLFRFLLETSLNANPKTQERRALRVALVFCPESVLRLASGLCFSRRFRLS